ncbi:MAG TPA: cytochrome c [Burkholderiales bacterium]|nr:cytochrome c [Burkholderiales bacterium]
MTTTIFGRTRAVNHWVVTTACMLLMLSGATLAADYEAGQKKAKEVCAACHGEDGNKPLTPETPRLAGQYYDYLEHSLKAYRSGARENPLMSPMAKPLSDKDIKDVAWYFSKQQGLASKY